MEEADREKYKYWVLSQLVCWMMNDNRQGVCECSTSDFIHFARSLALRQSKVTIFFVFYQISELDILATLFASGLLRQLIAIPKVMKDTVEPSS